ncbi:hypothetical protein Tco_1260634, partial [Tanacetum coccineum]
NHKSTRWQSFKMAKRLCLVDDLKMLKITMSNTSSRNKLNPEINDHYNILTGECQKDELKTKDKALSLDYMNLQNGNGFPLLMFHGTVSEELNSLGSEKTSSRPSTRIFSPPPRLLQSPVEL